VPHGPKAPSWHNLGGFHFARCAARDAARRTGLEAERSRDQQTSDRSEHDYYAENPKRNQACSFFLEHVPLPDGPILELRVLGSLGVGDALIFQPCIQFGEALCPWLGSEHLVAQIADLVLDLPLLPSRAGVQATGSIR
jgi:hypothetical protein